MKAPSESCRRPGSHARKMPEAPAGRTRKDDRLRPAVKSLPAIGLAIAVLLGVLSPPAAKSVTAEDFGFGNMLVNGAPVSGRIPLLIIVFELDTADGSR